MRNLCISFFLTLAACSPAPNHDAIFSHQDGAAFIGLGREGEFDAAILCDDHERTGDADWPPIAAMILLPEPGDNFEFAGKGYARVDGRKVKVDLSVRIDGRDFPVVNKKVRRDEQLQRAVLVGSIDAGEKLPDAINTAKVIEIAGDGRKMRADIGGVEDRSAVAEACRNVAH